MQNKKRLFPLLTFCLSLTCAFAFIACEQSDTSSIDSNSEESSFTSVEESSIEDSSSDENSSDDSSSDETPTLPEKMSESEWQAALSKETLTNCTMSGETATGDGEIIDTLICKVDGNKMHTTLTEGGVSMETYYESVDDILYMYTDVYGTGNFTKTNLNEIFPDSAPTFEEISPAMFTILAPLYSEFTFDADTESYSLDDEELGNLLLKFDNGKLSYFRATDQEEVGEPPVLTTLTTTYVLNAYGTTTVTLPTVETPTDVVGDGVITATEFAAALDSSAFENVKISYTIPASDDSAEITTTVWFDGTTNVKVFGDFGDFTLTEWWTAAGAFVYDATASQWVASEYPVGYDVADNLRTSFSAFSSLYSTLLFDGYTATLAIDETNLTFRFNEQEQLVYYNDGSMEWTFSAYGEVTNVLPF